ncbi:MAG: transglutaminase-like domain-containing protein [Candidatus Hadarchaeales archaeon]
MYGVKKSAAIIISSFILIILAPSATAQEKTAVYSVNFNYEVKNTGMNEALDVKITIHLFDNIHGWADQVVLSENLRMDGIRISPNITRGKENRWTEIDVGRLEPGESRTISVAQVVKVTGVDFNINPGNVRDDFPAELTEYTNPVPGLFESDDSRIAGLAGELTSGVTNPYLKFNRIFEFIIENLRYETQDADHGALWAFLTRYGDCTEFSNLMIALARASGIPAKAVVGYACSSVYEGRDSGTSWIGHEYAIVYMPGYGWIPADAVWPMPYGSLGSTDQYRIVGSATGGDGIVGENGNISWPIPGHVSRTWRYSSGRPTTVSGDMNMNVIPEVMARVDLNAEGEIREDTLTLKLTLKNLGRSFIENISFLMDDEPGIFMVSETPLFPQYLGAGEEWTGNFKLKILENGYGGTISLEPAVVFDSSYPEMAGICSSGKLSVQIPEKPPAQHRQEDILLPVIIGVIVGIAIVGLAIAIRR